MEGVANNVASLLKKQSDAAKYYQRLCVESRKKIKQLEEDNLFLQRLLATAIKDHTVVYRRDEGDKIPEFRLDENIEGEMLIMLKGWK